MKIILLAILAVSLAGCASVPSEYNQGCRDGMLAFTPDFIRDQPNTKSVTDHVCEELERAYRNERRIRGLENRR